ncbi:Cleavage and polyadenylation specificity factor subunit 1 [Gracilariopsis chorda]|uniref:Cleavage and polyadenylation specificity factor subunit 1 n=1 Tax=Gracilariopsis chorda TaxID=448386 RepID=A0A2V3IUR1_9FLOR|nr:Cleavage and polyadenylation specificity factor subunit 1 [Gracilariopsis chorda]|eukprot:PXF45854.1 Cleavage and polyadenylation specificity factor subunit 1 [Gracilariopsis chorda]
MNGVVREFQAPLGVTHAARGHFGPTATSLSTVFVRNRTLDLYVVRASSHVARLELLQSTPLDANVVSMGVLSHASSHDLLILAFDRMRVAILGWHHDTRTWIAVQLLDHASFLGSPLCSPSSIMRSQDPRDLGRPILRGFIGMDSHALIKTDPSGRCLGVLAKKQNVLYIAPISTEEDTTSIPSKVVNLQDVFLVDFPSDYEATNIKDFVFLHGSFEPNVVVLYEPKRTWAGRAAIQRNTSYVLNVSIDIQSKRTSKTWTMDQLPYDSVRLEPIPESAGGGILLLCSSVIMQIRHGACVAGLSLNCFGDAYAAEIKSKYETIKESDTLVECDGAHCRFLDIEETSSDSSSPPMQSTALLSLKGGELYFLNIAVASRNSIVMKRAGSTVIASEIVPINHRFFVLASRLSDSLLVEYQKVAQDADFDVEKTKNDASMKSEEKLASLDPNINRKKKKRKRSVQDEAEYEMIYGVKPPQDSSDDESNDEHEEEEPSLNLDQKDEGTRGVYDDDDELGWVFNSETDETITKSACGTGNWALKVKDTLVCFGPGADLAIGRSPGDETGIKLDMVIAGGYAKNGCLAVVHQSIRPTYSANFEVPGCSGVWAMQDPLSVQRERRSLQKRNEAKKERNSTKRKHNAKQIMQRKRYVEEALKRFRTHIVGDGETSGRDLKPGSTAMQGVSEEFDGAGSKTANETNQKNIESLTRESEGNGTDTGAEEVSAKAPMMADKSCSSDEKPKMITKAGDDLNDIAALRTEVKHMNTGERNEIGSPIKPRDDITGSGLRQGAVDAKEASKQLDTEMVAASKSCTRSQDNESPSNDNDDDTPVCKRRKSILSGPSERDENEEESETISADIIQGIENDAEVKFPLEEEESLEEGIPDDPTLHSILLMSTDSNTMVLRSGAELEEMNPEAMGFIGTEETLVAGNIYGSYAIVQVTPTKLKVLRDSKVLSEFDMSQISVTVTKAQICDPLILLESLDGDVIVLSVTATECEEHGRKVADSSLRMSDDEFDEYGMGGASRGRRVENSSAQGKGPNTNPPCIAYKNFSISVDFSSSQTQSSLGPCTAACLYAGTIANDIVEDGVLKGQYESEGSKQMTTSNGYEPSEMTTERAPDTDGSGMGERDEDEVIEDEDRMLYGENNEDEDDRLLYRTGEEEKGVSANITKREVKHGESSTGDLPPSGLEGIAIDSSTSEKGTVPLPERTLQGSKNSYLLLLVGKDGCLKVLSRELQYATVFEYPFFYAAPSLAGDVGAVTEDVKTQQFPAAAEELMIDGCALVDLPCSAVLQNLSVPVLVAISRNGMPLLYRVFLASRSGISSASRSRIVFERIVHRDRTTYLLSRSLKHSRRRTQTVERPPVITPFQNIAGRSGLFVGGNVPFFVFAERGYPRVHPLTQTSLAYANISRDELECSQSVMAFTEFHNVMCPRGFVCIFSEGETRIGELPPLNVVNYDAPTPMRKIALRCTPHKVAYHSGSATYGILASMPTLTTREERLARILQSLEKHDKRHYLYTAAQAEAETGNEQANRVPPLFEELHELRVYRPDTWDLIKSHKLAKGEVGLAIANMTVDVYKQKLAKDGEIHRNLNGEDAGSRGRLLLFEVSRQEGYTTSGSFTSFQLQLIAEKDLPAPVTAVAAMEGYVIAGVGPQISVYKLVGDELVHLSFAFGQLYCTSIATLKQYVVAADMCKSVSFMYFRDRNNSVNFLGKDYEHVTSYATEFLIENENMSIIVSDRSGNFQLMNYAHASNPQSRGGKRLLVNGGVHFGSRVNKFVRFRIPDTKAMVETGEAALKAGKHSLLFATLDGGIGGLIAVTETEYKNLDKLWSFMVNETAVQRLVGIHPTEQCAFRAERASTVLLDQRLLDSRAIFDVFSLPLVELKLAAKNAGVDMDFLIDILLEMDGVLSRF